MSTILDKFVSYVSLGGTQPGFSKERAEKSTLLGILRQQIAAVITVSVGILVSGAVFVWTQHYVRSGERQEFERQAQHYIQTVVNSIELHEQYIRDLARGFEGPVPMDRWAFDEYAQDLIDRHSGLVALAWIPFVPAARRPEFERTAREDGLFGFRIRQQDAGGAIIDAPPHDFYFPVYFAVPFDTDRDFLGIDFYAVPEYRDALDFAGSSGQPVVLPDVQDGEPSLANGSFQFVRPVYEFPNESASRAPKDQRLRGFVTGALKLDWIVEAVLEELTTPAWLDVYVYSNNSSTAADRQALFFAPSRLRTAATSPLSMSEVRNGLHSQETFSLGDMELSIFVKAVAAKYGFESSILPYWAGSFGLLLTLFIAYNLAAAHARTRVIERTVSERTAALSEANLSLHNEILERERVELELRSAKDEAEVANRAKSEFLAMVSHELRTPLNAIIGFSDIMSQEVFGPVGNRKYRDYIADIRKSGTHLLGLINNILDISKVESGSFKLKEEPVNLESGVTEILRLLSELAEVGNVTVETEVPADLPDLLGDPQAIRQILLNLLSNAIKFTEPGGHVCVGACVDEAGQIVLSVRDDGIGIPPESVAKVFRPFTQVDSSLARKFEGTGLGLPLTRSLVELHGGTVDLESKLGEGTKVTVIFPKKRVTQEATQQ